VTPQILTQFHYPTNGRESQITVPSTFPVKNRRVLHIPTVRLNYRTPKGDRIRVVQRIDEIIASRIGTKGIIHTVSFARANFILEYSQYAECMMTYGDWTAQEAVDIFKQRGTPCILLAPSVATGFNFPDDECRWQIIAKVPYPSTADAIMKARVKANVGLSSRIAAQALVQACGRGCRHRHDSCETFIVDDTVTFLIGNKRGLFPDWFLESYGRAETIPEPQEGLP
jgi:Rad3-related DNA helicase